MTGLLHDYLRRQAEARPEATAVVMEEERLAYGALEEESNRLARLLGEAGLERGDRVCLLLPKAPSTIVAMLATLKAGGAYVPLDVSSPAPRLEKIVRQAEPRLVFLDRSSAGLADELVAAGALAGARLATVEEAPVEGRSFRTELSGRDAAGLSGEPPSAAVRPSDPAHLLFTSGSTGVPKGVVITHANVVPFVDWAVGYFGIGPGDRNSGHPPLHFDLSTFDVYGTFAGGAELHLVPAELNLLAASLAAFIRRSQLTQWFSVPSTMTFMAASGVLGEGDLPTLRRVLWCGEVLPTAVLLHWMERVPQARYTNLYGPTEATIASSYYTLPGPPASETEPIPIGTPCPGEELLVLDGSLRPAPPGEVGDLYIAGPGLSPGYWRDEEKTRAAFLPDPRAPEGGGRIYRTGDLARLGEDGLLYFVGRADQQVKSRGYRIELGEIETALATLEDVAEGAVVGVEAGGFEGTTICCAYAPRRPVEPPQVREALGRLLPAYMLPTRWLVLDLLPKNVNGKIDRRLIREMFAAGRDRAGGETVMAARGRR